jgi:translation initiation factor IF-3
VEVAPAANPPVCRIMDHSKYKYEQSKRAKEAKKKQKIIEVKEVKLKPKIEEHDYQVKLNYIIKFLKKGDRVKINLRFRGREITHPEIGRKLLERIINDSKEYAQVTKEPSLYGKSMIMYLESK